MRCCVSSCNTTSENTSQSDCITFHSFPSEVHLRSAWLRALGKQDSPLPDSAVVCSQHFLNDDIYETECGLRQIVTGAIPSTVQVCMICLDTDSKLILMSKHKLEETYEKLTGHPLCDRVNLKPTLCVQCAQRLINFRKFRDKSSRARALMMDLVDKHKLITRQHIKMINRTKHQLKSSMVLTTLGPDHCDLHILEHPSEDKHTESDANGHRIVVKTEESDNSMSVDKNIELLNEDRNNVNDFVQDPFNYESAPFQCTVCLEEFIHEHGYMQHTSVHLQNGAGDGKCDTSQVCKPHTAVSSSSSHSSLITENKQADPSPSARAAQTSGVPLSAKLVAENENKVQTKVEADADEKYIEIDIDFNYQTPTGSAVNTTENNFIAPIKYESVPFQCTLCLEEFIHEHMYMQHMTVHLQNGAGDGECDTSQVCKPHTAVSSSSSHFITENKQADPGPSPQAAQTTGDIFATKVVQRQDVSLMKTRRDAMSCDSRNTVSEDVNNYQATSQNEVPTTSMYSRRRRRREYIEPVTNSTSIAKVVVLKSLQSNSSNNVINIHCINSSLISSHTKNKSFICDICGKNYKQKSFLVKHIKTHSKVRQLTCEICQHKCKFKSLLARHMRTHTREKTLTCNICNSKFVHGSSLLYHMRTHTGTKAYACELCEFKCVQKSDLVRHMRIHTGKKPYSCQICEYKCSDKSRLVYHMRTHTGEKPFTCSICNSKFAHSSSLVHHMRTHTGIKAYACELCEYKCAKKSNLVRHMRKHTGKKL